MKLSSNRRFSPFESPVWSLVVKKETELNRSTRQFFAPMTRTKPPVRQRKLTADLRAQYRSVLERCCLAALVTLILLFQGARLVSLNTKPLTSSGFTIEVADIPQTEQKPRNLHRPLVPSVPIPTLDESVPEDVTIEATDMSLDLTTLPAPPPPPESEEASEAMVFVPYDEPPLPIGGFTGIMQRVKYPPIAIRAGMEATVVVAALISKDGRTLKTYILKDSGSNIGFEEAAQAAVMGTKWKPAKQRDKSIQVWISLPIKFQLLDIQAKPVS